MTVYNALREYLVEYGILANRFNHLLWIWEKYTLEFLKGDLFKNIEGAKESEDREKLRSAVHRMKGEALNLGIEPLATACNNMLNVLKKNPNDAKKIEEEYLEIKRIYYDMREIYKKYFSE